MMARNLSDHARIGVACSVFVIASLSTAFVCAAAPRQNARDPLSIETALRHKESLRHQLIKVAGYIVWDSGEASISAGRFGEPGNDVCLNLRFDDYNIRDQHARNGQTVTVRGTLEEYDCRGANGGRYKECLYRCSDWFLNHAEFAD
jgi:hypothetical protein